MITVSHPFMIVDTAVEVVAVMVITATRAMVKVSLFEYNVVF